MRALEWQYLKNIVLPNFNCVGETVQLSNSPHEAATSGSNRPTKKATSR